MRADPSPVPGVYLVAQEGDQEPNEFLASEAGAHEKDDFFFLNTTSNLCNYF